MVWEFANISLMAETVVCSSMLCSAVWQFHLMDHGFRTLSAFCLIELGCRVLDGGCNGCCSHFSFFNFDGAKNFDKDNNDNDFNYQQLNDNEQF